MLAGSGRSDDQLMWRRENIIADESYKRQSRFFLNENVWISLKIPLKFVSKGPINNIPALVQIMAWRRPGDWPLSELMLVFVPTHICVTRPQWDNNHSAEYKIGWDFPVKSPFRAFQVLIRLHYWKCRDAVALRYLWDNVDQEDSYKVTKVDVERSNTCKMHNRSIMWKHFHVMKESVECLSLQDLNILCLAK